MEELTNASYRVSALVNMFLYIHVCALYTTRRKLEVNIFGGVSGDDMSSGGNILNANADRILLVIDVDSL